MQIFTAIKIMPLGGTVALRHICSVQPWHQTKTIVRRRNLNSHKEEEEEVEEKCFLLIATVQFSRVDLKGFAFSRITVAACCPRQPAPPPPPVNKTRGWLPGWESVENSARCATLT